MPWIYTLARPGQGWPNLGQRSLKHDRVECSRQAGVARLHFSPDLGPLTSTPSILAQRFKRPTLPHVACVFPQRGKSPSRGQDIFCLGTCGQNCFPAHCSWSAWESREGSLSTWINTTTELGKYSRSDMVNCSSDCNEFDWLLVATILDLILI